MAPATRLASLRHSITSSLRQRVPWAVALHFVRRGDRLDERRGELARGVERDLDRHPGARPEAGIHEVEGDRLLVEGVVRMVVRHHRVGEVEPATLALAGAFRPDDFNDGSAHAVRYFERCFSQNANTFFQPSSACSMRYIGRS